MTQWWDDIKQLIRNTAIHKTKTLFLCSATKFADDIFFDHLSRLISTFEIIELLNNEERVELLDLNAKTFKDNVILFSFVKLMENLIELCKTLSARRLWKIFSFECGKICALFCAFHPTIRFIVPSLFIPRFLNTLRSFGAYPPLIPTCN